MGLLDIFKGKLVDPTYPGVHGGRRHHHHHRGRGGEVGPQVVALAHALRHRLLRHRVHGVHRLPLRHRPLRRRGAALLARGRPTSCSWRARSPTSWPGPEDHLRPDARAQVGHLHGRLRVVGRLLPLLPRDAGDRRDHPGGRLRAGLPAFARGADRGHHEDPGEDPEGRAGQGPPGRRIGWAPPATAPSTAGPGARPGPRTTPSGCSRACRRAGVLAAPRPAGGRSTPRRPHHG